MTEETKAVFKKRHVYNLTYELIWCTYLKTPVFTTPSKQAELKTILAAIMKRNQAAIVKLEVTEHEVFLTFSLAPTTNVVNLIKALKGHSAKAYLIKHPSTLPHLWSNSYYLQTLGNLSAPDISRYLTSQKYNQTREEPNHED